MAAKKKRKKKANPNQLDLFPSPPSPARKKRRKKRTSSAEFPPLRPRSNRVPTSDAAADSMADHVSRLCAEVYDYIDVKKGRTCDEIVAMTGHLHQTISARINDLHSRYKRIVDSGERRQTRSGRPAIVWKVIPRKT